MEHTKKGIQQIIHGPRNVKDEWYYFYTVRAPMQTWPAPLPELPMNEKETKILLRLHSNAGLISHRFLPRKQVLQAFHKGPFFNFVANESTRPQSYRKYKLSIRLHDCIPTIVLGGAAQTLCQDENRCKIW